MTPDNPPAFPITPDHVGCGEGMTLRDWFAGQALAGFCANAEVMRSVVDVDADNAPSTVANLALAFADALLAEREKRND